MIVFIYFFEKMPLLRPAIDDKKMNEEVYCVFCFFYLQMTL